MALLIAIGQTRLNNRALGRAVGRALKAWLLLYLSRPATGLLYLYNTPHHALSTAVATPPGHIGPLIGSSLISLVMCWGRPL